MSLYERRRCHVGNTYLFNIGTKVNFFGEYEDVVCPPARWL